MVRKYDEQLVRDIEEQQYSRLIRGVAVTVKPIPDETHQGAMDPRLYKETKKMARIMKFMPKKMTEFNAEPKTIERMRKMFNNVDSTSFVQGVTEEKRTVKAVDGYDIPIYIYKSNHTLDKAPILYFIHGGGFFAGHTDVVKEALSYIADKFGFICIGVDYRLAPENPYPTGHEDCYSVLKWIHENAADLGGNASNIFVAGDSAGGNLTLYCSNKAIEEGKKYIKGQIILYPTVNMGGIQDEMTEFSLDKFEIYDKQRSVIEPMLTMMSGGTTALPDILGTTDIMNPYLTPYMEVSSNLPPTMLTCGEHDSLVLETLGYAKKLTAAGVKNEVTLYQGLGHAYIDHMGNYPQAEDCANDIGKFMLKYSKVN